jgi:hypothetical protein
MMPHLIQSYQLRNDTMTECHVDISRTIYTVNFLDNSREAKLCFAVRPDVTGEASDSPARKHHHTILIKIRTRHTNLTLFIPL